VAAAIAIATTPQARRAQPVVVADEVARVVDVAVKAAKAAKGVKGVKEEPRDLEAPVAAGAEDATGTRARPRRKAAPAIRA
jgi:hypothetical protein